MKTETKTTLLFAGLILAVLTISILFNLSEVKVIVFNILN